MKIFLFFTFVYSSVRNGCKLEWKRCYHEAAALYNLKSLDRNLKPPISPLIPHSVGSGRTRLSAAEKIERVDPVIFFPKKTFILRQSVIQERKCGNLKKKREKSGIINKLL